MSSLEARWTALGIAGDTLHAAALDTLGRQATVAALSGESVPPPETPQDGHVLLEDSLVGLGPVLGTGGMGVVRLARQLGLRREVAVKQLHPESNSPELAQALLREAWISGNLEHPNIVPVHALSLAGDGPMLVMKRVEGTPWSELLDAAERDDEALERHLEILIQVCHSVHFAHDRGVLHLDIKPANVMVGRFGEVYLLDWGIAASVEKRPEAPAWIPRTGAIRGIVGTPSYVSPEQAVGDGRELGIATDVYLLGATLHHVLTGAPPHDAPSVREALELAYACKPQRYPDTLPAELVSILHRAMARNPAERFQSADAFRHALEDFRRHRSSRELTREAQTTLATLKEAIARGDQGVELEHGIASCRYAFRHALQVWPENPEARRGQEDLLRLLVEHALAERDWRRAAATLAELEAPDPELEQRVDDLHAELEASAAKQVELEELDRQMDLGIHRRTRSRVAAAGGVTWLVWNLGSAYLHKSGLLVFDHRVLLTSAVATFVMYGIVLFAVRKTLLATRVNRFGMLILWAILAGVIPLWFGAANMGVPPQSAVALSLAGFLFFLVAIAATVEVRVLWSAPVVVATVVVAMSDPTYAFEMNALGGFAMGATLAWVWRARAGDGDESPEPS